MLQFEPVEAEAKIFYGKDLIAECSNETTFHMSNNAKAGVLPSPQPADEG